MDLVSILGIINIVANVVTKAIPFVEELFSGSSNSGPAKKAVVMNMTKVALQGVEGSVIQNNPDYAILEPLISQFIDGAVKAMNQIQATQGTGPGLKPVPEPIPEEAAVDLGDPIRG